MLFLNFRRNPCPNLQKDEGLTHGSWKCEDNKNSKATCQNERTGQVCNLNCKHPYKVALLKILILLVGHFKFCTV